MRITRWLMVATIVASTGHTRLRSEAPSAADLLRAQRAAEAAGKRLQVRERPRATWKRGGASQADDRPAAPGASRRSRSRR